MSSFKGGRSGNRGTCAQPCRQKYKIDGIKKEDYYLSPCDLSLFDKLKDISQMNISCIKIEGRMRNKEYLFNRGFFTGLIDDNPIRSLKAGHIGL